MSLLMFHIHTHSPRTSTDICLPKSHRSLCQKASQSQSLLQMAELLGVSNERIHFGSSWPPCLWRDIWSCWASLGTDLGCHVNCKRAPYISHYCLHTQYSSFVAILVHGAKSRVPEMQAETGKLVFVPARQPADHLWLPSRCVSNRAEYLHESKPSVHPVIPQIKLYEEVKSLYPFLSCQLSEGWA